ncbi:MAG: TatD family hydrolase [Clostridia bacterium]|nr:TatD family hydrolase [Clostridia bacterium]
MERLIFDTHAHYQDKAFDADRDELLASLPEKGVKRVVNCGTTAESSKQCKTLSERYDYLYFAAGIHPEDCAGTTDEDLAGIRAFTQHEKCVAIGEIGLDNHYPEPSKEEQLKVFEAQLQMAKELSLPVIIHDREAHGDTMELLKKYRPAGVMHCFSGSVEMSKEVLSLGLYIGLGGAVTFKNAKKAVQVAQSVPLDRLLLETDCPYMAPTPYRGKRNDSALIPLVAGFIGELRGKTCEEILKITAANADALFFHN